MNILSANQLKKFDFAVILNGLKRWKLILLALVVAFPAFFETAHVLSVWRAINGTTLSAVRYGVTGEYAPAYCADPCDSEAAQDSARLNSIYDVVHQELAKASVDEGPAHDLLRVTVCSNRSGYQYDAQDSLCTPRNDPGSSGDRLVVDITYSYPLGSFLGGGSVTIPLRAVNSGIVEAFRNSRGVSLPAGFGVTNTVTSEVPAGSSERLVVVTGDVQLIVADVNGSVEQISHLAADAGGYVVQSTSGYDGQQHFANMKVRIPADKFEATLARVKALSIQVMQENVTGSDVTEEHVDLEAHLQALQATADQLNELLKKAQTVDEALHVNVELGKLQDQIDQATGRKQYLENQAALATLTVALSAEQPRPALAPFSWQPNITVEKAFRFLVAAAYFVGDLLIWGVVVGLPILLLGWFCVWGIRRLRRPKRT